EIRVLSIYESHLGTTQRKQHTTYAARWVMMYSLFVQHNIGSIVLRTVELDDLPRSGRPLELDVDLLKQLIEQDPRLTSRYLAKQLGCSYTAVEKHLNELGKRWKYGVWIPHELSSQQLQCRVDACMDLMTSHRNYQWLRSLTTGDEKWVLYVNYMNRRQWLSRDQTGVATPKTALHPMNVMLSV
ncbi:unnamed protein product, partial [Adineta ricciae]